MPLPSLTVRRTDEPAPLEGQDVDTGTGLLSSAEAAMQSTLGSSLVARGLGEIYSATDQNAARWVPRKAAEDIMRAQNYDPGVLPDDGLTVGHLTAIMRQQSAIARSNDLAARSRLGGFARVTTSLVGGFADPLFLAAGPVAGRVTGAVTNRVVGGVVQAGRVARAAPATTEAAQAARAASASRASLSTTGRAAAGAAEGGALMTGYESGRVALGTAPGDRDASTYDMARNVAIGTLLAGGMHATFGRGDAVRLERSAAAAAAHNRAHPEAPITAAQVVSPAGAIGEHQVMPDMHRNPAGGLYTKEQLLDPKINAEAADVIIARLNKQYGGDGEAVSIAYNGGQKWANRWLASGRNDAILKPETRDYLARFREGKGLPGGQDVMADETIAPSQRGRSALTVRDEHDVAMETNDTIYRRTGADIEARMDTGAPSIFAREEPRPLPPEVMQDVGRASIRNALDDVREDMKPVVEESLARRTGTPVEGVAPKPRSIYDTADTRAQQERVNAVPPAPKGTAEAGPLTTAEKVHTDEAMQEAKSFAAQLGDEEGFAKHMADLDEAELAHTTETDAIEAAFRCGVLKGL